MSQTPAPQAVEPQPAAEQPKKKRTWLVVLIVVAVLVGATALLYRPIDDYLWERKRAKRDAAAATVGNDFMTAYINRDFDTLMSMTKAPTMGGTAYLTADQLNKVLDGVDASYNIQHSFGYDSSASIAVDLTLDGRTETLQLSFSKEGDTFKTNDLLVQLVPTPGFKVNGIESSGTDYENGFPGIDTFTGPDSPYLEVVPKLAAKQRLFPDDEVGQVVMAPTKAVVDEMVAKFNALLDECEAGANSKCGWYPQDYTMAPGATYQLGSRNLFKDASDQMSRPMKHENGVWSSFRWYADYAVFVTGTGYPKKIDGSQVTIDYDNPVELKQARFTESSVLTITVTEGGYELKIT